MRAESLKELGILDSSMASHSTSTTSAGLYHGSGLTKAAAGAGSGSGSGVPAVGVAVGSVDDDDVSIDVLILFFIVILPLFPILHSNSFALNCSYICCV